MTNRSDKKSVVTEDLSTLINSEINTPCPEEGISRRLMGNQELTGCKFEDGLLLIYMIDKGRPMALVLKPVEWRKA